VPTKPALSLFLLNWTGGKNMRNDSWIEIRARRDHSPVTVTGKTD